jgi:hypothetical protein
MLPYNTHNEEESMPHFGSVLQRLMDISKKTGVSFDDVVKVTIALEEDQKAEHDVHALTPENKTKIKEAFAKSNGEFQDLSVREACAKIGIEPNRGNMNFVRVQRKLLGYGGKHSG